VKQFLWIGLLAGAATLPAAQDPSQTAGPLTVRGGTQVETLNAVPVPPRVGIAGQTTLTLQDVIQRVLDNDPDLEISRILKLEAGYGIKGAQGYYDPIMGFQAYRTRAVTPIA